MPQQLHGVASSPLWDWLSYGCPPPPFDTVSAMFGRQSAIGGYIR